MNVVFSLILLAAALGCIVFLLTRRENARRGAFLRGAEEMPAAASMAPAAFPNSVPTCRWTTASTGWTGTARTTSLPTSAAVRTMAVSCSI